MTITSNITQTAKTARPPKEHRPGKDTVNAEPAIKAMLTMAPAEPKQSPAQHQERTTLGVVPVPADAHPDAYALQISEPGAGLRLPAGCSVMVEPLLPAKAGLAVLYRKNGGPEVWDLTQNFMPGVFDVPEDDATLTPLVEVIQVTTGRMGWLNTDDFEHAHRVIGIYTPAELIRKAKSCLPADLPLMSVCPDGMGEHLVPDAVLYPLVRPRETVVYDPEKRELVSGGVYVLQWGGGHRNVMQANKRSVGSATDSWWIDPINRPNLGQLTKITPSDCIPVAHLSDGPYDPEHLQEKIVGTIVGILERGPDDRETRRGKRAPLPPTAKQQAEEAPEAPPNAVDEAAFLDELVAREGLLALEERFDRAHAAWRLAAEANREPTERYQAAIETSKAVHDGTPTMEDIKAAWALPGVTEAHSADDEAFATVADLARSILKQPAENIEGLALQARALIPHVWAQGGFEGDEALGDNEEMREEAVRCLITSACALAGVDWRGQRVGKPISTQDAAAIDFEPIEMDVPERSGKQWREKLAGYATDLAIIDLTLRKTKPDVVTMMASLMETDAGESLFDSLRETTEHLKVLSGLAETAHLRILCAAAVVAQRQGA